MGQELFLGHNFIKSNSDNFYDYNIAFVTFFDWTIKNYEKYLFLVVFRNFWLFLMVQSKNYLKSKVVVHKNRH